MSYYGASMKQDLNKWTRLEPTAETLYKLALSEPCFPQAPNYAPLTNFNV